VIFFCLHGTVENYGFLDPGEVVMIGLLIVAGVLLFFLVALFFTRNYLFAALISFFVSLWYLFFGALHDWIKSKAWLFFLHGYSVLLPVLLVATIAWVIYLRRNKKNHQQWAFYLNLLLLLYCSIDGCLLVKNYFTGYKKTMGLIEFDTTKVRQKPNVYFLLFDEYPGYQSLKDSFAFANDSLYGFLQRKQFTVLPVFSNYDYTFFSMSSILNMQYVSKDYDPADVNQHDLQLRLNEIRYAGVFSIFSKMGYDIRNCSIFDVGNQAGIANQNAILPVHSLLLTDKILHNRIIRNSGWLFTTGKFAIPFLRKRFLFQTDADNKRAEEMVKDIAVSKKRSPVFVYGHFLLPHLPFYRDSTGRFNDDDLVFNDHPDKYNALFVSYVKYTNTVIRSLVDTIKQNDKGALIIVMSDHGKRMYNTANYSEPSSYNNICAVHFPDSNYVPFRDKWSTVNFFRYVFNCEFGQRMPYPGDTTIAIKHTYY
jgi:hypothetical protein